MYFTKIAAKAWYEHANTSIYIILRLSQKKNAYDKLFYFIKLILSKYIHKAIGNCMLSMYLKLIMYEHSNIVVVVVYMYLHKFLFC